ncbi:methyltransferase family protein [Frankia sp. EI5c]|uniref:class I SAM-dependent methyltransferase n=1 Tax=Frankia sp. EI5c TaxID=683316 RepID=UPI0007C40621|nr:class I SAM-dependent methyltransferase [Frankia sp. EI5c]OAA23250.1 methyltransferase family protein [Frankia sp. EI5c]
MSILEGSGGSQPPPLGPRHPVDFERFYESTPPWDIGRPQTAFVTLADAGLLRGRVLDVGCGTGEHALLAAAHGLEALGVDTSATAIERAAAKAAERCLTARFEVRNVLDLAGLGQSFDTVLDCGLFHVLTDEDRAAFIRSLGGVVPAGGRYFMLCFNETVPGDIGPRRVSEAEIRASFADGWRVDAVEPATLEVTIFTEGIPSWLASITRS